MATKNKSNKSVKRNSLRALNGREWQPKKKTHLFDLMKIIILGYLKRR